ncbi:MAG: DUF2254 domain-containing protein [Ornithinimicrobium sp.]
MTSPVDPSTTPAPMAEPRRSGGLGRLWRRAFSPFWMVPAMCCLFALAAGLLLPQVDEELGQYVPFLFQAGPDGARSMLSTIAGAMISVTGLVFSITIVVLQLASSQFSPRVLRTFLDDRTPQLTLGIFSASFVYALTVMRDVSGSSDGSAEPVPQIALTVAFVLVLASVGLFLAFIHHITQSISVDTIIRTVGQETLALVRRGRPTSKEHPDAGERDDSPGPGSARAPSEDPGQVVVLVESSGYLNSVNHRDLIALASRHDGCVTMLQPLGTYVVTSQPVALVTCPGGRDDVDWGAEVRKNLRIAWRRSMDQDVTFGLRQLVDIGERALSPGVNDPTTAVQVLNQLHTILHCMIETGEVSTRMRDEDGRVRLVSSEWSFGEYLDLCVDEIAHWGAVSVQIPARLNQMLVQLEQIANPAQREKLQTKRYAVESQARQARERA